MKKKNLQSLVLNKKSISYLKLEIYGGVDKDKIKIPTKSRFQGCGM